MNLPSYLLRLSEGGEPALTHGLEPGADHARAFARLVQLGVLDRQEDATSWSPCAGCDCGAEERPIRWDGERPIAACPVDAGQDTPLHASEIESYRLRPIQFVAQVSQVAGLDRVPDLVVPALWLLGRVTADRTLILAMSTSALQHAGALDRLRALDRATRFTLIANITATTEIAALAERGIDVISPDEAFLPSLPQKPIRLDMDLIRDARAMMVPPLLAVHEAAVTAVYRGIPLTLRRRDFDVLLVLVREAKDGAAALREDLYQALSGAADPDDPPAPAQIDNSINRLRSAFAVAANAPPAFGHEVIVTVRRHGYRLNIPADRIQAD